jgi:hypothetical protein
VYWLISLAFVAVAISVQGVAFHEVSQAARLRARATFAAEDQKGLMKAKANEFAVRAGIIVAVGLISAIGSLVCVVISSRKHEPAWRSVPFALLIFYVLLQFAIL